MNRVVTGYDDNGDPAVIRQGEPPVVIHAGRYTTTELWVSERGPITAGDVDASARGWALEPPPGGACFRVTLGPGDSVVQQPGVPHDWQNRSSERAVMVGVLLSAG